MSIFTKIINGDIPSYKITENEGCIKWKEPNIIREETAKHPNPDTNTESENIRGDKKTKARIGN